MFQSRPLWIALSLLICLATTTLHAEKISASAKFKQLKQRADERIAQLQKIQDNYRVAETDQQRQHLIQTYNTIIAEMRQMQPELNQAALTTYFEAPNQDETVTQYVAAIIPSWLSRDRYEEAYEVGKKLIEHQHPEKTLIEQTAIAAFNVNAYDDAQKYAQQAIDANNGTRLTAHFIEQIEQYRKLWAAEQAIRAKEAQADDLPRVRFETTEGAIDIELFENQAPNAVANFIHLVEKGFYNNVVFHRVLPGFMAQGGDPTGTGSGGPGWRIACECVNDNYRRHFRGTLSMAHAGRDTGGSQFFLTFVPTSHLDGQHTAFGRIINGIETLGDLHRVDPQRGPSNQPISQIIKATVLRKRDHAYEPKKIGN